MDFKSRKKLEELATMLRKSFGLPISDEDYSIFEQIDYETLKKAIQLAFPCIAINDTKVYNISIIKNNQKDLDSNNEIDCFEIYIDKTKKEVELLMLIVSNVFLHKQDIPYDTPIGIYFGTWEQILASEYFSCSFLIPENYFIKALSLYSRNDGTVDLEAFSSRFKVSKNLIFKRGRDLKIW